MSTGPRVPEAVLEELWPTQRSHAWWVTALLVLAGTALAAFRLGTDVFDGVMWAEDGDVFLTDAHRSGFWSILFKPYEGYPQVVGRLLTAPVALLPIEAQGVAMVVAASLLLGVLGGIVHHVVASHARGPIAPLLAMIAVVACPTGPETVLSVANLQWYLLPAACLVVFVRPSSRAFLVASCVVVALYVLSSPFGAGPVLLALAAMFLTRSRQATWLAGTSVLALVVACYLMVTAPPRAQRLGSGLDPDLAIRGYLARVVGDGVLGIARHHVLPSLAIGGACAVLAALVVLAATVWISHGRASLLLPGLLVAVSVAVWVILVLLSGLDPVHPFGGGRYAVPPTIFFLVAVALLVGRALERGTSWRSWSGGVGAAVAVGFLVSLAYGMISSYVVADAYGRGTIPDWATQVDQAQDRCKAGGDSVQMLGIAPDAWFARIPCDDLVDD